MPDIDGEMRTAAMDGLIPKVEEFLGQGADVNSTNYHKNTALHLATFHGHQKMVEFLLNQSADAEVPNVNGQTPLQLACVKGHIDIVKIYTSMDVDLHIQTGFSEMTALHFASKEGKAEICQHLLDCGADEDILDVMGLNAEYYAANYPTELVFKKWRAKKGDDSPKRGLSLGLSGKRSAGPYGSYGSRKAVRFESDSDEDSVPYIPKHKNKKNSGKADGSGAKLGGGPENGGKSNGGPENGGKSNGGPENGGKSNGGPENSGKSNGGTGNGANAGDKKGEGDSGKGGKSGDNNSGVNDKDSNRTADNKSDHNANAGAKSGGSGANASPGTDTNDSGANDRKKQGGGNSDDNNGGDGYGDYPELPEEGRLGFSDGEIDNADDDGGNDYNSWDSDDSQGGGRHGDGPNRRGYMSEGDALMPDGRSKRLRSARQRSAARHRQNYDDDSDEDDYDADNGGDPNSRNRNPIGGRGIIKRNDFKIPKYKLNYNFDKKGGNYGKDDGRRGGNWNKLKNHEFEWSDKFKSRQNMSIWDRLGISKNNQSNPNSNKTDPRNRPQNKIPANQSPDRNRDRRPLGRPTDANQAQNKNKKEMTQEERERKKYGYVRSQSNWDKLRDKQFEWSEEYKQRQAQGVFNRLLGGKRTVHEKSDKPSAPANETKSKKDDTKEFKF